MRISHWLLKRLGAANKWWWLLLIDLEGDGMGLLMGLVKKQKKNQMGKEKCGFLF